MKLVQFTTVLFSLIWFPHVLQAGKGPLQNIDDVENFFTELEPQTNATTRKNAVISNDIAKKLAPLLEISAELIENGYADGMSVDAGINLLVDLYTQGLHLLKTPITQDDAAKIRYLTTEYTAILHQFRRTPETTMMPRLYFLRDQNSKENPSYRHDICKRIAESISRLYDQYSESNRTADVKKISTASAGLILGFAHNSIRIHTRLGRHIKASKTHILPKFGLFYSQRTVCGSCRADRCFLPRQDHNPHLIIIGVPDSNDSCYACKYPGFGLGLGTFSGGLQRLFYKSSNSNGVEEFWKNFLHRRWHPKVSRVGFNPNVLIKIIQSIKPPTSDVPTSNRWV